MQLASKKIWLIGASEGIGEALARQLADAGAQLALSARNAEKLAQLADGLSGQEHLALPLDVTQLDTVQRAWQALRERWGGIDMVIYNAGTYTPMSAMRFDLARSEQALDVNFRGALRVLDCVLPDFIAKQGGHIVLVCSVAAYVGLPNAIGYGASKAALLHLAENLKLDLARANIVVQAVCPGFVKTRLTEKNDFPMPCMVSPDYAARAIITGIGSGHFEIDFPRRFTRLVKLLSLLPYAIYFRLASRLV